MAATKDIMFVREVGDINQFNMAAGAVIYKGTAVGFTGSNTARALVAADKFLGFAEDGRDNTGGAAGDKTVRVISKGMVILTVATLAATTAPGTSVYASDDNTYTLVSTGNSLVGKVHRVEAGATKAVVAFDASLV